MTANELLQSLGAMMGVPSLQFDEEQYCYLEVDDGLIPISLEADEGGVKVLAAAEVARLQEGMEEAPVALLAMNGGLYPLERGIFVLEGENADMVNYMQLFIPSRLDEETFLKQFNLFVATAREWRRRLLSPDFGFTMDDAPADTPSMDGAMRI